MLFQRHDQQRDQNDLDDDAGDGGGDSTGPECGQAEGGYIQSCAYQPGSAPYQTACHHGNQQRHINAALFLGKLLIQRAGHRAVGCQRKGHADGYREHGRHAEGDGAKQRCYEAYHQSPGPAAAEAAQQSGDVHGTEHRAYLRDLAGEEGQHQGDCQKQGRQDQFFHIGLFHVFLSLLIDCLHYSKRKISPQAPWGDIIF